MSKLPFVLWVLGWPYVTNPDPSKMEGLGVLVWWVIWIGVGVLVYE